jgi:hypothetical protein
MLEPFPPELGVPIASSRLADEPTSLASTTKEQPHDIRAESVRLPPQETIEHVDGHLLPGVADDLLHRPINQPSISKRNEAHQRSEQTILRSPEYELAMLCDAVTRFKTTQYAAVGLGACRDKSSPPRGTETHSSHIEGVLEKAVDYIHHLEERGRVLEQEGGALKAEPAFWTGLS